MPKIGPLLLVVALSFSLGCHRTVYYGLSDPATVGSQTVPVEPASRWQHFFLFGWVPGERTIDARAACGGTHKIREIRTRQTFLQGLIEVLASYYVNIYSPWTGEVVCQ